MSTIGHLFGNVRNAEIRYPSMIGANKNLLICSV
jgi:hypothetical protein